GWRRISVTSPEGARPHPVRPSRRLDAQPPEPGFRAAVLQHDVTLAQLAELRKVAKPAARDALRELLAREGAAQHLTPADPVVHQRTVHHAACDVVVITAVML